MVVHNQLRGRRLVIADALPARRGRARPGESAVARLRATAAAARPDAAIAGTLAGVCRRVAPGQTSRCRRLVAAGHRLSRRRNGTADTWRDWRRRLLYTFGRTLVCQSIGNSFSGWEQLSSAAARASGSLRRPPPAMRSSTPHGRDDVVNGRSMVAELANASSASAAHIQRLSTTWWDRLEAGSGSGAFHTTLRSRSACSTCIDLRAHRGASGARSRRRGGSMDRWENRRMQQILQWSLRISGTVNMAALDRQRPLGQRRPFPEEFHRLAGAQA
jgi:hypothetical protein